MLLARQHRGLTECRRRAQHTARGHGTELLQQIPVRGLFLRFCRCGGAGAVSEHFSQWCCEKLGSFVSVFLAQRCFLSLLRLVLKRVLHAIGQVPGIPPLPLIARHISPDLR